jgi:hypothetical protein
MGLIDSVILMVLGGLATVFIAVISRLLADDIKAWLPKLTDRYIEQAVNGLPEQERERFAEEWRSYVNDTPGDISKLVVAFGFLHASSRMARSARVSVQEIAVPTAERVAAGLILMALAPMIGVVAFLIRIESGSPVMFRRPASINNSKSPYIFKFVTIQSERSSDGSVKMTRIGGFLRKTRIDELPILFNVVQGTVRLPISIAILKKIFFW